MAEGSEEHKAATKETQHTAERTDENSAEVKLMAEGCSAYITTAAHSGQIEWSVKAQDIPETSCFLHVSVPVGLYLTTRLHVEDDQTCWEKSAKNAMPHIFEAYDTWPFGQYAARLNCNNSPYFHALFSSTNQLYLATYLYSDVVISFNTSRHFQKNILPVVMQSDTFGYITSPAFDGVSHCPPNANAEHELNVPQGFAAVMLSFERLSMGYDSVCYNHYLEMSIAKPDINANSTGNETAQSPSAERTVSQFEVRRLCNHKQWSPSVFRTDRIILKLSVGRVTNTNIGFKLLFSFHKEQAVPQKNPQGRFNCSASSFYSTFQKHLACNMLEECLDGRDEKEQCWFSSQKCEGNMASGSKCFFPVFTSSDMLPQSSDNMLPRSSDNMLPQSYKDKRAKTRLMDQLSAKCNEKGGDLAIIQTKKELEDLYTMLSFGTVGDRCKILVTGVVYGEDSHPNMYRKMWTGRNKTILYKFIISPRLKGYSQGKVHLGECRVLMPPHVPNHALFPCDSDQICGAVCETSVFEGSTTGITISLHLPSNSQHSNKDTLSRSVVQLSPQTLSKSMATSGMYQNAYQRSQTKVFLVLCPKGHLTHLFMLCDTQNDCGTDGFTRRCGYPTLFTLSTHSNTSLLHPDNYQGLRNSSNPESYTNPESRKRHGGRMESLSSIREFETTQDTERTSDSGQHTDEMEMFISMFACDNGLQTVHYSQVCDFKADCDDQSDETLCQHPPCTQFACTNGQCVSFNSLCDQLTDCLDNSDTDTCDANGFLAIRTGLQTTTPTLINLDGRGYFVQQPLNDTEPCPDTHYRCSTGEAQDCLPVYTRCNGYSDCLHGVDEKDCENSTCPGFYRCRASPVCVHLDHLCDGWAQCPQGDDEWLCQEHPCPDGCLCYGLAFVCSQPFPQDLFPKLRYLDGTSSRMDPSDFNTNHYLMHLILRDCALKQVTAIKLRNLRHLDLSRNQLSNLSMNAFLDLKNLKVLELGSNPLRELRSEQSHLRQSALRVLDLTNTELYSFSGRVLYNFVSLHFLNLSRARVHTITEDGFQHIPSLTVIDLRGCPVKKFPQEIFQGLVRMRRVFAGTYKLCCKSILPGNFDENFCFAPQDEISSCDDLLRSGTYRGFLWLMSVLSITGNAFCLVFRSLIQKKRSKGAFNIFVSSLCLADFTMGVYVAIIGSADLAFRGIYLHYDVFWTNSAACKVAGFLCLLSSEVSALTVLMITLDRFIVLRFPFSRMRFGRMSATAACFLVWLVGFILAVVPVLPATSHWDFYSQTGICIPLPITRQDFGGRHYSVAVVIIFNFVLFLFIAGGQAVIYWSVRKNSMTSSSGTSRKSKEATVARRLITVAVTDFLCWFPIGVCGLLALSGTPIAGEVNVAMAIFVLPLNSAFNPFLYTVNTVLEKRRRASEERMLRMLQAKLADNC